MPLSQTTVPNQFAAVTTATGAQLDADFTAVLNALNNPTTPSNYLIDTGTANNYVVTFPAGLVPGSYTAGLQVQMLVANSNTGASTINVNGLGVKNITRSGATAVNGGDLLAGAVVSLQYDGTQFQIQSQVSSISVTNVGSNLFNEINFGGF